jgi:hypothetical protein
MLQDSRYTPPIGVQLHFRPGICLWVAGVFGLDSYEAAIAGGDSLPLAWSGVIG